MGCTGPLFCAKYQGVSHVRRVALYARVSSEEQRERQTITNQVEFFHRYIALHGLRADGEYLDEAVSGTIPLHDRPAGARLLAAAAAGSFDAILLFRLDRIGRDPRVILEAIHSLEQHQVVVRSMTEPFDTSSAPGRLMITMLSGFAGYERETLLERVALGKARRARAGKWTGGLIPYGYRVTDQGDLAVCEDPIPGTDLTEAGVIRLLYDLVGQKGWTCSQAAAYLNSLAIPTAYGRYKAGATKWWSSQVARMLHGSIYRGLRRYGGPEARVGEIEQQVPAIVSAALWDAAQHQIASNRIATNRSGRNYLLRRLMKCGLCGYYYCGSYRGPKRKTSYYICHGHSRWGCRNRAIPVEWIEDRVWTDIERFLRHPGQVLMALRRTLATRPQAQVDVTGGLATIDDALRRLESGKDSILGLYRRGAISMADVERQLAHADAERQALLARHEELEAQRRAAQWSPPETKKLLATLRQKLDAGLDGATKRAIIEQLVEGITVTSTQGTRETLIEVRYGFTPASGCAAKHPLGRVVQCATNLQMQHIYRGTTRRLPKQGPRSQPRPQEHSAS